MKEKIKIKHLQSIQKSDKIRTRKNYEKIKNKEVD